ncbi:MAG: T9SS type A sorting domain-containing protein [Bacteroidales bacterium]|nr:T9SS type A sorting domain-containing protein [Bacteroidales bacterium]
MKKLFLLLATTVLLFSNAYSQTIPNDDFEYWTLNTLYENPDLWNSSNAQLTMMGMLPNCTKSTDNFSGSFAAKLETTSNGQDSVNGILLIGMPGNQTIDGGLPFAACPDTVIVHLKYNILPNDTGHFIVFFKNNSAIIGSAGINLTGTQLSYAEFKLPVYWAMPGNADTIAALITSSNLDYSVIPGSTLFVDGIGFIGTSVPFPNGDFENWTPITSEEPDNWNTLNYAKSTVPSATKSTDFYSGSYAIRIETINTIWGDPMGYITNGQLGANGPEGGVPVALNPFTITGYYKYLPSGLDTALVMVFSSRYDPVLDSTIMLDMALLKLPPTSTYTQFIVNLNYNNWPYADTVNISFASSNLMDSLAYIGVGSALFIDNLNIDYFPVSIFDNLSNQNITIYPNPANDILNIDFNNDIIFSELSVFDLFGRKIINNEIDSNNKNLKIDVSGLNSGVYFIEFYSGTDLVIKEKIIINKR